MNRFPRHAGIFACALGLAIAMLPSAHALLARQDAGDGELVLVGAPASYLGVNIRDIDEHSARLLGLKTASGVEVIAVDHDAPAGKSGIRLRDVIVAVDGRQVKSAKEFRETMRALPPGRQVTLAVLREGKPVKFVIKLVDRAKLQQQAFLEHFTVPLPALGSSFSNAVAMQNALAGQEPGEDAADAPAPPVAGEFRIGALLDSIGPQLAAYFGVKDGSGMLVKHVEPGGPASAAGLQAGDVICKLNDEPVATPLDWMRSMQTAVSTPEKPITLTIVRNKRVETLTLVQPKTQARLEWPALLRYQAQCRSGQVRYR